MAKHGVFRERTRVTRDGVQRSQPQAGGKSSKDEIANAIAAWIFVPGGIMVILFALYAFLKWLVGA